MTTIILQVNENELLELISYLTSNKKDFVDWVEQPENVISAVALKPIDVLKENELVAFIKRFKLFK